MFKWIKKKLKKFWKWLGILLIGGTAVVYAVGAPVDTSFENLPNIQKIGNNYRIEMSEGMQVDLADDIVSLTKWGGEVKIDITNPVVGNSKQENGKLKWKGSKKEVHAYPVENGFEYEIILKEKPLTNKVELKIETKGLDFFYQPALTQKEIDEGAFRPENVIGSYAVYHSTKKNHIIGQTNYKTGKAFHIYRPKIIDANGDWIWGELNIDTKNGIMTTTIAWDFLNTATYPISIK